MMKCNNILSIVMLLGVFTLFVTPVITFAQEDDLDDIIQWFPQGKYRFINFRDLETFRKADKEFPDLTLVMTSHHASLDGYTGRIPEEISSSAISVATAIPLKVKVNVGKLKKDIENPLDPKGDLLPPAQIKWMCIFLRTLLR